MANLSILTPRAMEVLLVLFAGLSKPSSAKELFISEILLALYLDYIRTKLDTEAPRMAATLTPRQEGGIKTREIPREMVEVRRL